MHQKISIELLDNHADQWQSVEPMLKHQRLPQALLLIGPAHASLINFAYRFIARVVCEAEISPCGECPACLMLSAAAHPDIKLITPEDEKTVIKIDAIRELQHTAYATPQCAPHRFIIINPAEKLNIAAVNALLKIVEEPPVHLTFIFIANHITELPATIISRCQRIIFPDPVSLVTYYDLDVTHVQEMSFKESYKLILAQKAAIEADLCALILGKKNICQVARSWSEYAFDALLWVLSLISMRTIHCIMNKKSTNTVFNQLPITQHFQQQDRLYVLTKKIHKNLQFNQLLALEVFLLGYLPA